MSVVKIDRCMRCDDPACIVPDVNSIRWSVERFVTIHRQTQTPEEKQAQHTRVTALKDWKKWK